LTMVAEWISRVDKAIYFRILISRVNGP